MADGMDPGLSAINRKEQAAPIHQDPLVVTVAGLEKGHPWTNKPKPVPDQDQERVLVSSVTAKGIFSWIALARTDINGMEQ